jgi:hypothetical protein
VKDLHLPPGVKADAGPDLLVAIVQEHKVEESSRPRPSRAVEPELIKKPKETEEGAEGEAPRARRRKPLPRRKKRSSGVNVHRARASGTTTRSTPARGITSAG